MAPKQYLRSKHLFFRNQWLPSRRYAEIPNTSDITLVLFQTSPQQCQITRNFFVKFREAELPLRNLYPKR